MANPNRLKIDYNPSSKEISFYLYEDENEIRPVFFEYEKYLSKEFEFSFDNMQDTFFDEILSPFASCPKIMVDFFSSEKIYYEFFKLAAKNYAKNFCLQSENIIFHIVNSDAERKSDESCVDKKENLNDIEKEKINKALSYFYDLSEDDDPKATPESALSLIEPVFMDHKNDEYVLSVYLPIYVKNYFNDSKVDVEKFLDSQDKMSLSVNLAYIDLYLNQQKFTEAEKIADSTYNKFKDSILAKCYYVLVLLAAWKKYNSVHSFNLAVKIVEDLPESKDKLERSWINRIKYLLRLRQGNETENTEKESEELDLYKNFMKGAELSVGYSIFDEYSNIQDAINFAHENESIYINQGVYEEAFQIDKKVNLIGNNAVIVVPYDKTCFVKENASLRNLIFTNDVNFKIESSPDEINDFNSLKMSSEDFDEVKPVLTITADTEIKDCYFSQSYGCSIRIAGKASVELNGIVVYNNYGYGIICGDKSKCTASNIKVNNNNWGVIVTDSSEFSVHEKSFFTNNKKFGIRFDEKSSGEIYDSEFNCENITSQSNSSIGILIKDKSTPVIKNSHINTCSDGIVVQNSASPNIVKCSFSKNLKSGLVLEDNSSGIFEKCNFNENNNQKNEGTGVCINSSVSFTLKNCEFSLNDIGISVETGTPQIEDCILKENKFIGLKAIDGNPVIRNIKISKSLYGLILGGTSSGNFYSFDISNNKIEQGNEVTGTGVLIEDKAKPVFYNGRIVQNHEAILLRTSQKVTFRDVVDISENDNFYVKAEKIVGPNNIESRGNKNDEEDSQGTLFGGIFKKFR